MEGQNTSKSIKIHAAQTNLRLPEEIIEEILSRLPAKSLLKFRCVSKSWCNLIGTEGFIKTHLQNSTKSTSLSHHRIILNPVYYSGRLPEQCSWQSILNEPVVDSISFDDLNKIRWGFIDLVGFCNGLVCVLLDSISFYLWNPATKISKKLPDTEHQQLGKKMVTYGFGYDESCSDYKVFCNFCFNTSGGYYDVGRLYSLKSNSWKTLNGWDPLPYEGTGKFASGNLHWVLKNKGKWDIITSFDLKGEVYRFIGVPSYLKGDFNKTLGVIEGCLSVVCDYPQSRIDVWVMKEYWVQESFVKVATVPNVHDPSEGRLLSPFGWGPSGEILLLYTYAFKLYHSKDDGNPRRINIDPVFEAGVYVESLVSLASSDEEERRVASPTRREAGVYVESLVSLYTLNDEDYWAYYQL